MIIPLKEVFYDLRARDGTWCKLPYPNHPKGCPNYPMCIEQRRDFREYRDYKWVAVVLEFDLKAHAEEMKNKPRKDGKEWTEAQARCVLYWQEHKVRRPLKEMVMKIYHPLRGDVLLDIPEVNGVNLFATMAKHDLYLKSKPDMVRKIMLVGRNRSSLSKANG